jgi:hypothetical protein
VEENNMKYIVQVLVQGFATVEIEANSNEEAIEKAMELNHDDFEIDYASIDYDASCKYREILDEDGNELENKKEDN